MLRGKQKRYLRSLATQIKPIFQVGKSGVSDNMIEQMKEALEKRELIKISILQNCIEDEDDVATSLSEGTNAELVQIIGNQIVLYKKSIENEQIELP
ncbi:MAG TPA: ribosome assembly RNA-binding protein YhbY [Candidatus Avamphibacillus intestinigallinarum]|nr:ribosome assembly RNA-binding protein YhbY [Candidatus Avamphibacillus intestinigallinarum]